MTNDALKESLTNLNNRGERELFLLERDPAVRDYWQERNQLIAEMSAAIERAVEEVQRQYLPQLEAIENEYAVYLAMITPSGNGP